MLRSTLPAPIPRDLAVAFMPVIQRIAKHLARRLPPHVSVDDMVSAGYLGLVDAHRRFDASRGHRFESYAEFRIRGAMLDELRAHDPLSRNLRVMARRAAAASQKLATTLGRSPRESELCREMTMTLDDYRAFCVRAATGGTVSIDAGGSSDDDEATLDLRDSAAIPADERLHEAESARAVRDAVGQLSERSRRVLELYYEGELTLRGIGELLGVTESRVCQIHAEAVAQLRTAARAGSKSLIPVAMNAPKKGRGRPRSAKVESTPPKSVKRARVARDRDGVISDPVMGRNRPAVATSAA